MYEEFYEYEKSISMSKKRELGIVYTPIDIDLGGSDHSPDTVHD